MQLILLLFTLVLFIAGLYCLDCPYREVVDYLQCKVCSTPELSGSISDDSCCNYETVDKTLEAHFYPILQKLVKVPFFRYFKVNLNKPCPFWSDDDGMCSNRECSVCECDESEVPRSWLNMKERPLVDLEERPCAEQIGQDFESRVEQVSKGEMDSTFNPWDQHKDDNIWIDQSEDNENEDMVYVNLLDNPEKFTGYSGRLAEKVWHAIYDENCFDTGDDEKCLEERVFYRLISGMQSSINTHIAAEYNGEHNVQLYVDRVGKHPERLQNLYFTYLFVIRAVSRARSLLLNYDYSTGIEKDEEQTIKWMKELIQEEDSPLPSDEAQSSAWSVEQKAVLAGFDENRLFAVNTKNMTLVEAIGAKKEQQVLEDQFRAKFQNISRIMDCVTCEKCQLWGKIQVMGIGTAIKIALADGDLPNLQRNEVIALINVLTKLSESVDAIRMFRTLEFNAAMNQVYKIIISGVLAVLVILMISITVKGKKAKCD